MSDPVTCLNTAREGRCAIEREAWRRGHRQGSHPIRLLTGVRPQTGIQNYEN